MGAGWGLGEGRLEVGGQGQHGDIQSPGDRQSWVNSWAGTHFDWSFGLGSGVLR